MAQMDHQLAKRVKDDEDRLITMWGKKARRNKNKYLHARKGDNMMSPFECDRCIFHKLRQAPPDPQNVKDKLLLACIRRANLDAFWSRSSETVSSHVGQVRSMLALADLVGIRPPIPAPGPLPSFDHCGYGVAIAMLLKSRMPGTYHSSHQQWDTVRKLRTAYGNGVRASGAANVSVTSVCDGEGKNYQRLSDDPCASLWFMRFVTGCKRRMGQDWRPDRAMTPQLMQHLLARVENRVMDLPGEANKVARHRWIYAGTYFAISYVLSLRGPEGLLMDLEGLRKHFNSQFGDDGSPEKHVVIALLGQVKGEHNERQHLIPSVNVTKSGIEVRRWVRRTLAANFAEGRKTGPAFCDEKGVVLTTRVMNEMFHEMLEEIRVEHKTLFLGDILSRADIEEKYNVYRSFRRGSDSRAIAMGVSPIDIDVVNRWTKKEAAGTSRVSHKMKHHYADVAILLPAFERYTRVM